MNDASRKPCEGRSIQKEGVQGLVFLKTILFGSLLLLMSGSSASTYYKSVPQHGNFRCSEDEYIIASWAEEQILRTVICIISLEFLKVICQAETELEHCDFCPSHS